MISIQTIITGILAIVLVLYFAGYIPIKSYLQHRRNRNNGLDLKECGYCAQRNATKRCTGCKSIYYCSVRCQASHWKSGHKKRCKSKSGKHKSVKKKKKSRDQKKKEFMAMLSSFSNLTTNEDDDEDDDEAKQSGFNDKEMREHYRTIIDPNKLKRRFVTYYSFKILGYDDTEIPPFEGDATIGEQEITMNEVVDSMIMTKRMILRDPELKHEIDKKIAAYKYSKGVTA